MRYITKNLLYIRGVYMAESILRNESKDFAKAKISHRTKRGISLKNNENAVACECEINI